MCGFVGIVLGKSHSGVDLMKATPRMANTLVHRGPDDSGLWYNKDKDVSLGHQRLSIVDRSAAGHQPMVSLSGRYVLVFNGEIYNHLELRKELGNQFVSSSVGSLEVMKGFKTKFSLEWKGYSDTETLLSCIEVWGLEQTLRSCVGMFAFALWDRTSSTLSLVRDRLGEKPLYYGLVGQGKELAFVFGSELKALRAYPNFNNPLSRKALAEYMHFSYVPTPYSIYEGIFKLPAGCVLQLTKKDIFSQNLSPDGKGPVKPYWSLDKAVETGVANPIINEGDALTALEDQLRMSINLQMISEVPLGVFLSGGVDSSIIAALMQVQSTRAIKTFTVGFEEAAFDESPHARAVAKHLGTDHSELYVTSSQAQSVISHLPKMYDEPFADSSQIPTHLVCNAARQKVTVALSGDAGDELFGGYNRYLWGPRIWNQLAWLPFILRQGVGFGIRALPINGWDLFGGLINWFRPGSKGISQLGDKVHKLGSTLTRVNSIEEIYLDLISKWNNPGVLVRNINGFSLDLRTAGFKKSIDQLKNLNPVEQMMYYDSLTYLPDDILCKVDRAAMAVSLETRIPFLDHRVVELSWKLPLSMKIRNYDGKWALRQILHRYVPRELIERPKAGFSIPIGQWLRGPLRDWAEELLNPSQLEQQGYFNSAPIQKVWTQHKSGRYDWTSKLWSVLMFQAWLESIR